MNDAFTPYVASLLHQIAQDFREKLRLSGLELEWEIDTMGLSPEARLYFWRCDAAGSKLNDLVDILEFSVEESLRNDVKRRDLGDWITTRINEIIRDHRHRCQS